MAKRKWKLCYSMGYAGTDNEEIVDLVEHFGCTEKEAKRMTDEEAKNMVAEEAYRIACEQVEGWAEPAEED